MPLSWATCALKTSDTLSLKREMWILLVDDQIMVRELLTEVLIDLGYRVLQAGDGAQGFKILNSGQQVDLLISDVGLPGHVNGRQLADAGRKLRPELKVLFITGCADEFANAGSPPGQDMKFMTKPFGLDEFERKVSAMTLNL